MIFNGICLYEDTLALPPTAKYTHTASFNHSPLRVCQWRDQHEFQQRSGATSYYPRKKV